MSNLLWLILMIAEREVLISTLKLTRNGCGDIKTISRDARVPPQIVCQILERNASSGILHISGSKIRANPEQRLRIAIKAADLGGDVERICEHLGWEEFEDISALAFEMNGFHVKKHFRFSWNERRFEIDLLALKRPFVVCVDCKQWRRGWRGIASRKAVEKQIQRTRSLAEASPGMTKKIGINGWNQVCFIPIILSLFPSAFRFHKNTPVVPIIQLRSFIQAMPAHIDEMNHYWIFIQQSR